LPPSSRRGRYPAEPAVSVVGGAAEKARDPPLRQCPSTVQRVQPARRHLQQRHGLELDAALGEAAAERGVVGQRFASLYRWLAGRPGADTGPFEATSVPYGSTPRHHAARGRCSFSLNASTSPFANVK